MCIYIYIYIGRSRPPSGGVMFRHMGGGHGPCCAARCHAFIFCPQARAIYRYAAILLSFVVTSVVLAGLCDDFCILIATLQTTTRLNTFHNCRDSIDGKGGTTADESHGTTTQHVSMLICIQSVLSR